MTHTPEPPAAQPERPPAAQPSDAPESSWLGLVALLGLLALLWVRAGWEFVLIVAAILVIVFLHELGHYVAAKRGGMKVTEFFLGFGPRIWSFTRGETEYGLKAIPAGAYVKVVGMNNLEEVDPADEPRTYRQQSYPKRLAVAVAGSAMHFLLALLLLYGLLVGWGIERDEGVWDIDEVSDASAAAAMGLEPGDRIVSIDGAAVATFDELAAAVSARPGDQVTLEVLRDGQTLTVSGDIGLNPDNPALGRLGVRRGQLPFVTHGPVEAIPETFVVFGEFSRDTVKALGRLVTPEGFGNLFGFDDDEASTTAGGSAGDSSDDGDRLISVIGFTQVGAGAVEAGVPAVLFLLAIFNVFIGIFNMVPLLPLDGGHVVIATYERIRELGRGWRGRRYHADAAKMLPLAYAVVIFLIVLGGVTIVRDIADPIQLQ